MRLFGFSLLAFWLCLILAGVKKGDWTYAATPVPFSEMQQGLRPLFIVFSIAGLGVFSGIVLMVSPLVSGLVRLVRPPGR